MTGPNNPPVAVPKYLYAQAVNGAMALALGQAQAAAAQSGQPALITVKSVIEMALNLARGKPLAR